LPAEQGAEARREEQRAIREIAETAHGVNLDLGASLLTSLSTVDSADMAVARFSSYADVRTGDVRPLIELSSLNGAEDALDVRYSERAG
jgi:hypothetical protein